MSIINWKGQCSLLEEDVIDYSTCICCFDQFFVNIAQLGGGREEASQVDRPRKKLRYDKQKKYLSEEFLRLGICSPKSISKRTFLFRRSYALSQQNASESHGD